MNKAVEVAKGVWKITLGTSEEITPVGKMFFETKFEDIDRISQETSLPFNTGEISFKETKRGCLIKIPLENEESIYGFGLQMKSFRQNGKKKTLRVNSDPVADTGDSHAPVPFYCSTSGYGVFVDTARYASFYCGSHTQINNLGEIKTDTEREKTGSKESTNSVDANSDERVISEDANSGIRIVTDDANNLTDNKPAIPSDNTEDLYAIRHTDNPKSMVIDIPVSKGVDIYIFAGPTIKQAVQRYNLFSGGGAMPAMWGLGIWYRTYTLMDQKQVLEQADKMRETKMPCDVLGLEPGWQTVAYSCSYEFYEGRFPDPDKLVEDLTARDFRVNLWEHVYVHPISKIYNALKPYSGDYEVWGGLVPDLSIPEASSIFTKYHTDNLAAKGISGFKLDECDNSDFIWSPWAHPEFAEFPSGMDGEQMHSLLGMLYEKTILDCFKPYNKRSYQQTRNSHGLAASYPFVLYSDLYDHKDFIRSILTSSFCGLLWSPEVRQCNSTEDLIRRLQTVVFSPLAMVNCWMITNPPWDQVDEKKNLAGELMENRDEITDICRDIFDLRMKFVPYLYSLFAKYSKEGVPPFRALVMDYPGDENVLSIDDQYLMGDGVLIAPVVESENSRNVYLPAGEWYYFWTNEKFEGGKTIEIAPPLSQIPIFIKSGTILPLAKPEQFVGDDTVFDITVNVYGESCEPFTLFEDDGVTYDFENGNFNEVVLSSFNGVNSFDRTGSYPSNRYDIVDWKNIK